VGDKSKSVDSSYIDFETRKSLHINLTRETHASLRIICFQHRLSMQEVIEEAAIQMIEETPYMVKMLLDLAEKKRKKAVKRIAKSDAESIFKVIEDANPFSVSADDGGGE